MRDARFYLPHNIKQIKKAEYICQKRVAKERASINYSLLYSNFINKHTIIV